MKKHVLFFTIAFLMISCSYSQNSNEKRFTFDKALEQELKKQDRAKYGGAVKNISIIEDSASVKQILAVIIPKIEKREKEAWEKTSHKPLVKRYVLENDSSVVSSIIGILKSNDKIKKDSVYREFFDVHLDAEEFVIKDPRLIRLILEKINVNEEQEEAIDLAGQYNLSGYLPIVEKKLFANEVINESRALYWLARDGKNKKVFDYILNKLNTNKFKDNDFCDYVYYLQLMAEKGDAQMQQAVGDWALTKYNRHDIPKHYFDEMKGTYSTGNPGEKVVECILQFGDARAMPVMYEYIQNDIRTEEALCGLIRLEGNKHRQKVYSFLEEPREFYKGLAPAIALYKKTHDHSICDKVLVSFENKNEDLLYRCLQTIQAMDSGYIETYNRKLISKDLAERIDKAYQLTKITQKEVLNDMVAMGLMDETRKNSLQAKLKPREGVWEILSKSDFYLWFDTETDRIPVDYDKLITDFAGMSNGKLKGLLVWLDATEKPDETYTYKIYVSFNLKIYTAEPEDIGDWYDINVVADMMNKVLFDAGSEERFIFMDTGDQTAQYMFGKEVAVKMFREKYGY